MRTSEKKSQFSIVSIAVGVSILGIISLAAGCGQGLTSPTPTPPVDYTHNAATPTPSDSTTATGATMIPHSDGPTSPPTINQPPFPPPK